MHTRQSSKCRIDTVISPEDGRTVLRNMYIKEINVRKQRKKNCAPIWLHLQDCTGMHGQQNIKIYVNFLLGLKAVQAFEKSVTVSVT